MSQVLVQKLKMSEILDDCVRTNKYKQVRGTVGSGNLACVMGLYAAYRGAGDDPQTRDDFINNSAEIKLHIEEGINVDDKQLLVNILKETYKKEGKIDFFAASCLNDNHKVSFAEFRDIFRGMGA